MSGLAAASPPLLTSAWTRISEWAHKARRSQGSRPASTTLGFASLPSAGGPRYRMDDFRSSEVLVVIFLSNRCPWVKAYTGRLSRLQLAYWHRGVQFVGINSLDDRINPKEDLASMAQVARRRNIPFPYLKDPDQSVARIFGASFAPHVVVLDRDRHVRYVGKVDDAFRENKVKTHYLRDALESVLLGQRVSIRATRSVGCSIYAESLATPKSPSSPPRELVAATSG